MRKQYIKTNIFGTHGQVIEKHNNQIVDHSIPGIQRRRGICLWMELVNRID